MFQWADLQGCSVQNNSLLHVALLFFHLSQIVEGPSMVRLQSKRLIVALLCLVHLPFLLQSVAQATVGIWEVGLQLNGSSAHLDGLFMFSARRANSVVHTSKTMLSVTTTWQGTSVMSRIFKSPISKGYNKHTQFLKPQTGCHKSVVGRLQDLTWSSIKSVYTRYHPWKHVFMAPHPWIW